MEDAAGRVEGGHVHEERTVDGGVAHEEEHGDDGRDHVDISRGDAAGADDHRHGERAARLAAPLQLAQRGQQVVVGDGLQQPRRAGERLERGADARHHDADPR